MSSERGKTAAYREAMTAIYHTILHEHKHQPILRYPSTHSSHHNKQRLEHLRILRKQIQPQIDEDEILRQLGEHCKHVFRRSLRLGGHGVVGVVFEGDAAEEEGDDTCHPNDHAPYPSFSYLSLPAKRG